MSDQERIKEIMVEEAPGFLDPGIPGAAHFAAVNNHLREEIIDQVLQWDQYLAIRHELRDESRLVVTRGAGGVVIKGTNADDELQGAVLGAIPDDQGIPRPALLNGLCQEYEHDRKNYFYEYLDYLNLVGKINIGPGRGGIVYKVQGLAPETPEPDEAGQVEQAVPGQEAAGKEQRAEREHGLYEPLIISLSNGAYSDYMHSRIDRNNPPCVFVNSAGQGRADTGGTWTRPDITIVTVSHPEYLGRFVEVTTIEVKPPKPPTVDGVYEALAHKALAHKVYLFQALPYGATGILQTREGARIRDECARHGLGLITFSDENDPETWSPEVTPVSHRPDPLMVQGWLDQCIDDENKQILQDLL